MIHAASARIFEVRAPETSLREQAGNSAGISRQVVVLGDDNVLPPEPGIYRDGGHRREEIIGGCPSRNRLFIRRDVVLEIYDLPDPLYSTARGGRTEPEPQVKRVAESMPRRKTPAGSSCTLPFHLRDSKNSRTKRRSK